MHYLHVIEAYLKIIIATFYFCQSKNLQISWKIFLILSFLKKYFLVKNHKKQMSYKENRVRLQKPIKFRL